MESEIKSIAVTGTPGCGKTTLCSKLPYPVLSVHDLAVKYDCIGPVESDGAAPIDIENLSKKWVKPDEITLIDGHLSHLLPVDAIVILRCKPEILRQRLTNREYSVVKVEENVEFELLGGVWADLLNDNRPKIEDSENIADWINSGCPNITSPFDAIDWISEI